MTLQNATRGRINRKAGAVAETIVELLLRTRGYRCVERVRTGWTVIWSQEPGKPRVPVKAFPQAKVSGDFRAVYQGRSVLVEVKKRADGKLSLSDFDTHQIAALNDHVDAGGISIVAWVFHGEVQMLAWPIAGLSRGNPLTWKIEPPAF